MMMKHWITATAILLAALPAFGQRGGGIEKRTYYFKEADKEMEYAIFVPKSYDKGKKNPLVVVLHGLGSNPHQIIRYQGITAEAEQRGYVVVAPYGYNERGWYGSHGKGRSPFRPNPNDPDNLGELSEKDVMNVLEIVRKGFSVDDNRVYLMGHSMGGGGTVHLGCTYPKIWAALGPLAPAVGGSRKVLEKMKHIPTMVVTGELDRLVKVDTVRHWVEKMKELEMTMVYKEIPGGNHFDTITRNPDMIAEVFDFFDKHSRNGGSASSGSGTLTYRVFTNKAGKKIKAKPVTVAEGKITIERDDGKSFTVLIASLSEEDQKYIEDWSDNNPRRVLAK